MNAQVRTLLFLRVNEEAMNFYSKSQELGELAVKSFLQEKDRQRHRAQMTGLENIAETTQKWTDVLDYIKKQMARLRGWTTLYDGKSFGESLKRYITDEVPICVERVCNNNKISIGNESDDDKRIRQQVYLDLIRQLIRQVVVQYEYRANEIEEESKEKEKKRRVR